MHDRDPKPAGTVQATRDISDSSRIIPLAIAGVCCFFIAVLTGTLAWYFIWLPSKTAAAPAPEPSQSSAAIEAQAPEPSPATPAAVAAAEAPVPVAAVAVFEPPAGSVYVDGAEVALAEGTNRPIERVLVDGFAIAETEVTNAQYAEFIRESGHAAPPGWKGHKFPADTDNFPVVNVSWKDAAAFCEWKSGKLGLPVRLPTEAEWELAARGPDQLRYPWGAEWNKEAAASKESGGKVSAVKSFPVNRSGSGAYDTVGNVWEWVADDIDESEVLSDTEAETARKQGKRLRIVKGGSAEESLTDMSGQSRYEVPEGTKIKVIGFRYAVVWKRPT